VLMSGLSSVSGSASSAPGNDKAGDRARDSVN
jgi:hypothetical protein